MNLGKILFELSKQPIALVFLIKNITDSIFCQKLIFRNLMIFVNHQENHESPLQIFLSLRESSEKASLYQASELPRPNSLTKYRMFSLSELKSTSNFSVLPCSISVMLSMILFSLCIERSREGFFLLLWAFVPTNSRQLMIYSIQQTPADSSLLKNLCFLSSPKPVRSFGLNRRLRHKKSIK